MKLYSEDGRYTPDGLHFDGEASRLIQPLIEKMVAEGCNPREATHLVADAVLLIGCEIILTEGVKESKERRLKSDLYRIDEVVEYRGYFVCRRDKSWRIKKNLDDSYSLHHSSFESAPDACEEIDSWLTKEET